jgi:hypothetical protein
MILGRAASWINSQVVHDVASWAEEACNRADPKPFEKNLGSINKLISRLLKIPRMVLSKMTDDDNNLATLELGQQPLLWMVVEGKICRGFCTR